MLYGVTCHLPFSPLPQVYTVLSAIGGGGGGEEERRREGEMMLQLSNKNSSAYW